MATDDIERLHYYQRQYLGALDFEDQQAYHRDMRRRLNLAHHTWGIVAGLELTPTNTKPGQPTDIYINPGMAIDGYGREMVIFQPQQLDPTLFQFFHDVNYHTVCLEYNEILTQSPQAGYGQCDQLNQFGRVVETFRVVVEDAFRDDITVNGQAASLASSSYTSIQDLEDMPILTQSPSSSSNAPKIPLDESIPYQELPNDDPTIPIVALWRIPLGEVLWDGTSGKRQFIGDKDHAVISEDGRHYIGAVASRLFAPAGKLIVRDRNTDLPFMLSSSVASASQPPVSTTPSQTTTNTTSNTNITGSAGNINVTSSSNSTSSTSASSTNANAPQTNTGTSPTDTSTSSAGVEMIIEGTLQVDRLLTAKDDIQIHGHVLDFRTVDGGGTRGQKDDNKLFTISRNDSGAAGGTDLRLKIGEDSSGKNRFVVGTTTNNDLFIVDDKGNAHLAGSMDDLSITGVLDFGSQPRQMIRLWSSQDKKQLNGIGIQASGSSPTSATTYFRSSNDFYWFKGGDHSDSPGEPGGGQIQLKLDGDGSLHFDKDTDADGRRRQMLNLSSARYGIGVQDSTLYFRSDFDFCWFRHGGHSSVANDPGPGGQLQLRLDRQGDLYFTGNLYFGQRLTQLLNLLSTAYGIGVQDSTLYFRSDFDFCWYRGGSPSPVANDPGGGTRQMRLDRNGALEVQGNDQGHIAFTSPTRGYTVTVGHVSDPINGTVSIFGAPNLCLDAEGAVIVRQSLHLSSPTRNGAVFFSNAAGINPGEVVVRINDTNIGTTTAENDPKVVGVATDDPGFVLMSDPQQSPQQGIFVAIAGFVKCNIDPGSDPIKVGSLLATGPTAGCAQLADDPPTSGTVLGKAMEAWPNSQGTNSILILVMLG